MFMFSSSSHKSIVYCLGISMNPEQGLLVEIGTLPHEVLFLCAYAHGLNTAHLEGVWG